MAKIIAGLADMDRNITNLANSLGDIEGHVNHISQCLNRNDNIAILD